MRALFLYITLSLPLIGAVAQTTTTPVSGVNTQPWDKNFMDGITVGGYYRLYYFDRILDNPYGDIGAERTISVVDPTYFDPMLFLYVGGNVTSNSSFGAELRVDSYMAGAAKQQEAVISMFNGLVLRANTSTKKAGDYDVRFGGIEWMNITPFTFGRNTGYNRYSVFTRQPWDPGGNVKARAASYYFNGTINQDVRFGTNGFKGLMVNATKLPYNLSGNFLYGFSQSVNGFDRAAKVQPRKVWGAKLVKDLDKLGEVGISTYNTIAYQDSIDRGYDVGKKFNMVESYAKLNFDKKLSVFAEVGYGVNTEPLSDQLSGTAFMLDVKSTKKLTKYPISLRAYRFGKYFINLDSYVGNTSSTPYLNNFFTENGGTFQPPGARMTGVGDMVNNRIGGNLNAEFKFGDLKIIAGMDMSSDIEAFEEVNTVSYGHRISGVDWSRFMPFPNPFGNFGPNSRVGTFYRGAYELVNISDTTSDGGLNKLYYNSVDLQMKYKMKIANRDLYLFNLNNFSSVSDQASIVPSMSDKSYIRASYHEVEAYYHVWRDITLSAYYGMEFIKGNAETDLELHTDSTDLNNITTELKSRDQIGKAFGLGIDYQLSNSTYLYIRQRWFDFEDRNFIDENFTGKLFTVELKVFF